MSNPGNQTSVYKLNGMKISSFCFIIFLSAACGAQNKRAADTVVGGGCEACDLIYKGMPGAMYWETTLTSANEPGEPMIISGVIYQKDGKTPASDVILYVYHTDKGGLYSPGTSENSSTRHGHIRGWMKTNSQGRYQFRTIRPGAYPQRDAPQHIHPLIKEPGYSVYWIDEILFDDDPLLTEKEKNKQQKHGGSGIIHLTKNAKGEWTGKRDIILGMNIPGY